MLDKVITRPQFSHFFPLWIYVQVTDGLASLLALVSTRLLSRYEVQGCVIVSEYPVIVLWTTFGRHGSQDSGRGAAKGL